MDCRARQEIAEENWREYSKPPARAGSRQTRTPSDSNLVVLSVRAGAHDWRALSVLSRIVIY